MDLLWWKVGSIFLMFLLVLFGGFLPTQLHVLAKNKREFALALGNAFSGGVFLCVGLVHLLPEASKQIESLRLGINDTLPISCTVALCGFLLIFCIEKIFLASSGTEENRAVSALAPHHPIHTNAPHPKQISDCGHSILGRVQEHGRRCHSGAWLGCCCLLRARPAQPSPA